MFSSLMHIAIYTDNIDEMIRFYTEQLGGILKYKVTYRIYLDREDRPENQKIVRVDPDRIFNAYVEIAPGQFLEFFPKQEGQVPDVPFGKRLGLFHFALLTENIFSKRAELEARGVAFDTDISKGPSGTYQMWTHDPDGNRFEIMQYTEESYQLKGAE